METTPPIPAQNVANTIFKNATFGTIGIVFLKFVNFGFNILIVRRLGDDRFGQYSIVLAFVMLFEILAELGMTEYVIRESARDIQNASQYFWNLVFLRFLLAVLAVIALPIIAAQIGYRPELILGIFLYSMSFVLAAFSVPLEAVLTSAEKMGHTTSINVIRQMTFVILGSIFLLSGLGYIWLIIAALVSLIPSIVICAVLIKRLNIVRLPFQLNPKIWLPLIRAGLPFGIVSLMLSIAYSLDTVMMSWYQSENIVGYYTLAYGLIFSISFLFGGIRNALVPSLSKLFVRSPEQIDRWYQGMFKYSFLFSAPISVGGMIVAFPLVTFLYSSEFLPAGLALQILIWDVPFLLFAQFCAGMAVVIGEEKASARINTINTVANIGLNLFFIPKFGLVGAALVTVTTDIISAFQYHYLLRKRLNLPNMTVPLVKITACSLLMAGPLLFAKNNNVHILVLLAIGIVTYVFWTLIFRLFSANELKQISGLARRLKLDKKVDEVV